MPLYTPPNRLISSTTPSNPFGGMKWCEVDTNGNPLYNWDWVWYGNVSGGKWLSEFRTASDGVLTNPGSYAGSTQGQFYPCASDFDMVIARYEIRPFFATTQDSVNYYQFGVELRTNANGGTGVLYKQTSSQSTNWGGSWGISLTDSTYLFVDTTANGLWGISSITVNGGGVVYWSFNANWAYARR